VAVFEDQLVQAKLISEEVDRKLVLMEQDLVTQRRKAVYNVNQHDNTHYTVEDVVGMRRTPILSVSLQSYRTRIEDYLRMSAECWNWMRLRVAGLQRQLIFLS